MEVVYGDMPQMRENISFTIIFTWLIVKAIVISTQSLLHKSTYEGHE